MMKKRRMRNYSNNYSTTTAGHNGRMRAAELARDSVFALVPCKEMARGSGALGSCTGVARDSLVALGSAAWNSRVRELCIKQVRRLVSEKNGERGVISIRYLYLLYSILIPMVLCVYLCVIVYLSLCSVLYINLVCSCIV